MSNPWKERAFALNRKRAENDAKAAEFMTFLDALPPGQVKQLLKDKKCAAILEKYGFSKEETE